MKFIIDELLCCTLTFTFLCVFRLRSPKVHFSIKEYTCYGVVVNEDGVTERWRQEYIN